MKQISLILLICCIAFSCTKKEKVTNETAFFDISNLVDSLLQIENKSTITRQLIVNGKKESKNLKDQDLTEIFEFLKQFNINHPKLYDKYKVTKTANETMYKAIEEGFDLREMKVIKNKTSIEEIQIYYKSENLISSSEKMIIWNPATKLDFKNTNKTLWSDPQHMDISWTYKL